MKTYSVFEYPQGERVAVKQGWSWPAFCFVAFWALYKKLWAVGFITFAAAIVVGIILDSLGSPDYGPIPLIFCIIFAIWGNKWRRNSLISKGYSLKGTVNARNSEQAVAIMLTESPHGAGGEAATACVKG
jgi:hypothetical protein